MKIAIMQPYFFPYIGYYQLINAVDKFIFYDDVNYIKQGWINRNNILVNNKRCLFSLPVENISSFKKINETKIDIEQFVRTKKKLTKTIEQSYKKAPFYNEINEIIQRVLNLNTSFVADFAKASIKNVCQYLNVQTEIIDSSLIYMNSHLKMEKRVIDICKKEKSKEYINSIGGKELYDKEFFKNNGISLSFIKPLDVKYKQLGNDFVPNLSIIDVLMYNNPKEITSFLNNYINI